MAATAWSGPIRVNSTELHYAAVACAYVNTYFYCGKGEGLSIGYAVDYSSQVGLCCCEPRG